MKYINKYLEYLKVVKKYSDKTIESYYDDLTLYNEFLGNNFINIFFVLLEWSFLLTLFRLLIILLYIIFKCVIR